jgi:hypothetical protein
MVTNPAMTEEQTHCIDHLHSIGELLLTRLTPLVFDFSHFCRLAHGHLFATRKIFMIRTCIVVLRQADRRRLNGPVSLPAATTRHRSPRNIVVSAVETAWPRAGVSTRFVFGLDTAR